MHLKLLLLCRLNSYGFFNRTLPFIKDKYKIDFENGYAFKAVYITTTKFEDDALEHLEKLNEGTFKPKRLDVFYDRRDSLDLLKKMILKL